jgi:hypothetical protein
MGLGETATITETEYVSWLTPKAALEQVAAHLGEQINACHQTLLTHLVDGYINAAAMHTALVQGAHRKGLEDYRLIKPAIWERLEASNPAFSFPVWKDGTVHVQFIIDRMSAAQEWKLVGVRIDPSGVEKYFPIAGPIKAVDTPTINPPAPTFTATPISSAPVYETASALAGTLSPSDGATAVTSLPPPKHAGGAPRKEFWDDLWLAMFERLWLTDWKPKKQAEIEKAMLNWAAENGHSLGPTSVKKPASKLFALCQK